MADLPSANLASFVAILRSDDEEIRRVISEALSEAIEEHDRRMKPRLATFLSSDKALDDLEVILREFIAHTQIHLLRALINAAVDGDDSRSPPARTLQ